MTETKKQILGIIFIGAGSSWYVDKDETTASKNVQKCARWIGGIYLSLNAVKILKLIFLT